jgi:hypothetical protein
MTNTTYRAHDFIKSRGHTAQVQELTAGGLMDWMNANPPQVPDCTPATPNTYTTATRTPIRVPAVSDNKTVDAVIQDGTYTLVYKDGSHFTFKISTPKRGNLRDKQIVSYLSGSDNENDYQGFGFVNTNGTIALWKRFVGTKMSERAGHLTTLFTMPARLEQAGLDYALTAGRCRRCNLKLTVPASIHRGYGPECIKHARGFAY